MGLLKMQMFFGMLGGLFGRGRRGGMMGGGLMGMMMMLMLLPMLGKMFTAGS